MANTLITPSIIAREGLFHLENNLVLGANVHREYKNEFVKIGDTVTIRKPVQFVASDGATRVNQDVTENTTSIVVNKRKHVSWKFTSQDLTLTLDEYAERYIKPAAIALANKIDSDLANEGADAFYNITGTPGVTPADFTALADAAERLDNLSAPDDGQRCLILNPAARWSLADGLGGSGSGGIFNAEIVGSMVRRGFLGEIAGFKIYGDQNVANHTCGAQGGTPLLNDAAFAQNTGTITIDGATASITNWARKGDIITIAGVNAVNPISKEDLGYLAEFVVTADANSDGSGNVTLTVTPALNDGSTLAPYQNVSALPADNAAITFKTGAGDAVHPQNLAFHKNALALVTVPLELPDSVTFKARMDWRGYSLRVVKDYDIDADEEIIRLDALYGVKAIYPDIGVRVTG